MTIVVLGASDNPERYSHKALVRLIAAGHKVVPVHPTLKEVEGLPVVRNIQSVREPVDTVTVYVNPTVLETIGPAIAELKPRRVIFNPGAENESVRQSLASRGIETIEACTLVMLSTGQF